MFERYTERARRAIFFARWEALSRGSSEIETKDLALGLTREAHQPDCPYSKLHEDAAELRSLLGADPCCTQPPQNRDIPLSKASKMCLAYARMEAEVDRRYSIGGDHLLRGILRVGDDAADKIAAIGYTLSVARESSMKAHRLTPAPPAPLSWRLRRHLGPILLIAALILCTAIALYLHWQN